MRPTTSTGLAARLKRYSPACRTRLAAGEAGQQKIPSGAHYAGLRQRVGDAAGARAVGKFDEGFTLETLVRLFQPVDGKAAGGESREEDEAEGGADRLIENPDNSARG